MSAQLQGNVEYFARSVVSRKPTMGFTKKDRVDSDPNKRIVSKRQQHFGPFDTCNSMLTTVQLHKLVEVHARHHKKGCQ